MIEVIITVVVPPEEKLVHGRGTSLMDRDRIEVVKPAHTQIHRLEFDTVEDINDWITSGRVRSYTKFM